MGKPAARIGDMHVCPMVTPGTPPVPHVGGPVVGPGVPTVLIGGMPAAVMGDMCTCVGPPDTIAIGSTGVLIGGKPAARLGDMTIHGGTVTVGLPTVLIGETMPGAPPVVVVVPGISNLRQVASTLTQPSKAYANQAAALTEASGSGVPFCQKCAELKAAKNS